MLISCHSAADADVTEKRSIAYLKGLCRGASYNVAEDVVVRGVVVATDWLGEYYKSIVVADESGGIEIAIDSHDICAVIPLYSEVEIYCNGLTLGRIGGKVSLGVSPTEDMPVDNIPASMVGRYIRVIRENVLRDYVPRTIESLTSDDICTPVFIENLHVAETQEKLMWCERDATGEFVTTVRTVVDSEGHSIDVRTLGGAIYAGEKIPENTFSLGGVADYADGRLFLRITNHCIIQP